MNILIFGAGAVGSWLAHRLSAVGHQVVAVGREPVVRAIRQRGLLVAEEGHLWHGARFEVVGSADELSDRSFDLVWITTKAYDVAAACVKIKPFVDRGAAVVVLQRGVGNVELAQVFTGRERLYAGVLYGGVEALKPGVIRPQPGRAGISLAAVGSGERLESLVQLLAGAGLDARAYPDWRALQWTALANDLVGNALPAILDQPPNDLYADPRLCDLERAVVRETRAVMARMHLEPVALPGPAARSLIWLICALPPAWARPLLRREVLRRGERPATLRHDVHRRRKSEILFLNGAVCRAGAKLGEPTPVNHMLYTSLDGIVRGQIAWARYRGQTDQLVRGLAPHLAPV